jgi:hypothetical protein
MISVRGRNGMRQEENLGRCDGERARLKGSVLEEAGARSKDERSKKAKDLVRINADRACGGGDEGPAALFELGKTSQMLGSKGGRRYTSQNSNILKMNYCMTRVALFEACLEHLRRGWRRYEEGGQKVVD